MEQTTITAFLQLLHRLVSCYWIFCFYELYSTRIQQNTAPGSSANQSTVGIIQQSILVPSSSFTDSNFQPPANQETQQEIQHDPTPRLQAIQEFIQESINDQFSKVFKMIRLKEKSKATICANIQSLNNKYNQTMSEGDANYRVKKLEEDGDYLLEFVIRLLKEKKEKEAQQLALEVKKIHLLIGGKLGFIKNNELLYCVITAQKVWDDTPINIVSGREDDHVDKNRRKRKAEEFKQRSKTIRAERRFYSSPGANVPPLQQITLPDGRVIEDCDTIEFDPSQKNTYSMIKIVHAFFDEKGKLQTVIWFRTQKSREHVACVYGSPEMLRMYLNDPKNELAKILFLEMKNTPNKVDLNSNNKYHRVETEVYTATHCGFKGRKKH